MQPTITIEYCPKCNWLIRAAYMSQELLNTFSDELYGVTLQPSAVGGRYSVRIEAEMLFDREEHGRFPEITELKRLVRDRVCPEKSLGHSDQPKDAP